MDHSGVTGPIYGMPYKILKRSSRENAPVTITGGLITLYEIKVALRHRIIRIKMLLGRPRCDLLVLMNLKPGI